MTLRISLVVCGVFLLASAIGAQTKTTDFDRDSVGKPPAGFSFALTGQGKPGVWVIAKDASSPGQKNVLAQTDPDPTGYRFPVAVFDGFTATDVDISVKFKPISGKKDQAAGITWRYKDNNNYYIVRANALENNVVLYKVESGKRTDLPLKGEGRTYGKKAVVSANQWSELRVTAKGNLFAVYLNGEKLYEVEDSTFTEAGKVGLWTKADSVTYFDDLRVNTLPIAAQAQMVETVYVTNFGDDFISVIDANTNRKVADIRTGRKPHGAAVTPDGRRVYVSNEEDHNVSVIDPAINRVIATIAVGKTPNQLCVSRDGKALYVTNNGDATVSVIDTASNQIVATIPVGRNPHIIEAAPDGRRIYVTSEGDNKVSIIDHNTRTVIGEIPVFGFPRVLVISPDGKHLFLTLRWLNGILVIDADAKKVVAALDVGLPVFPAEGKAAHGPCLSPDGKYLYLTSQILNTVSVIEAATLKPLKSIPVGLDPNWIDLTADGRHAFVSNTASNDVSVIDTSAGKVIATIPVGRAPKRLTVGKVVTGH